MASACCWTQAVWLQILCSNLCIISLSLVFLVPLILPVHDKTELLWCTGSSKRLSLPLEFPASM